jgi:hypothetical protein
VIDASLKKWANQSEAEYIDAFISFGSYTAAGDALEVHRTTIQRAIERVEKRAANDRDINNYVVKGTSTLRNGSGEIVAEWTKTKLDDQRRLQALRDALVDACKPLPRVPATPAPAGTYEPLCNLYTLTDSHVGMLAWAKEGGADWDLKIAERELVGCFQHMVAAAPAARVGIVNQLGDFMHYDGLVAATPTHGHPLDADGRFSKMVATAIRILRRVVEFALEKHEVVHVIMAEGNHDIASSVWLRQMFMALYENEPRVIVNDSELPYYVIQHGKTMLAFHHGHLSKNDKLPLLFASQYPVMWGATTKRYAHTGHRHHDETKEHSGMKVTQHATLAARDAYAARGGWISERQATSYTYHTEHGQVASNTVTPEMLA